jgi:hypothetical protein
MLALITANEAWVQVPRHDPIPAGRPCLEDPAPGVEADDLPFEMDTGPFKDVRPDGHRRHRRHTAGILVM